MLRLFHKHSSSPFKPDRAPDNKLWTHNFHLSLEVKVGKPEERNPVMPTSWMHKSGDMKREKLGKTRRVHQIQRIRRESGGHLAGRPQTITDVVFSS